MLQIKGCGIFQKLADALLKLLGLVQDLTSSFSLFLTQKGAIAFLRVGQTSIHKTLKLYRGKILKQPVCCAKTIAANVQIEGVAAENAAYIRPV